MFYKRFREMREDHDIKQQTLADYIGCTQPAYSLYEQGKRNIPSEILVKIADFYNTSVDYLLERTDDPAPPSSKKSSNRSK